MTSLLSKTGAVLSLEDALILTKSQRQLWLCPSCYKSLVVLNSGGVSRVEHVEEDCNTPSIDNDALSKSLNLSSFIGQHWRLPDPYTGTLQKIERVSAFLWKNSSRPMALLQAYNFVAVLGVFVAKDSNFSEVENIASKLGVRPLALKLPEFSWSNLEAALTGSDEKIAVLSLKGALSSTPRLAGRYQLFDACMKRNAIVRHRKIGRSLVSENKKIEHFNSAGPQSISDFLEDALTVLRIIKAANWVYALIFNGINKDRVVIDHPSLDTGWFDVLSVQVPNFWLRFFVVTEALSEVGHAETANDLAYKLTLQHADRLEGEDFRTIVHELSSYLEPLLNELLDAGFLEHNGYQFACVRPMQQRKSS